MTLHRHAFKFKMEGQDEPITVWAAVKDAKAPVTLVVTAEDVQRSIDASGIGSTQKCTMAVCAKRSSGSFSHPVEGYVDWQYSRAYVVSKIKNGLPSECVAYRHGNDIAKVNDTKNGQRKLLEMLKAEGPKTVTLYPIGKKRRKAKAQWSAVYRRDRPEGRTDGLGGRSSRAKTGAAARFAFAKLNGAV